jgi:hypothetical protein
VASSRRRRTSWWASRAARLAVSSSRSKKVVSTGHSPPHPWDSVYYSDDPNTGPGARAPAVGAKEQSIISGRRLPESGGALAATIAVDGPVASRRAALARRWLLLGTVLVLAGLGALYYAARRPILPIDDATLYVTGAQALAQGQGYRLIGYVGQPFNTFYPPAYSLYLMPVFWLQPAFPANLSLLQLANLIAFYVFLAVGALVLRQAYRASGLEIALALLLTATTPLALLLSTAVLSDTLFGALALGSVSLVQRSAGAAGRRGLALLGAAALLATLAYYTRSAGVALLLALAVETFRRARRGGPWPAVIVLLLPLLLVVPWSVWTGINGGSSYLRHWIGTAPGWSVGVDSPESLLVVLLGNLLLGADALWAVAPALVHPDVGPGLSAIPPLGWLIGAPLIVFALWRSWRTWQRGGAVVHLFLALYLLTTLLWPYRVAGRFVWPVAPLLAWYLVVGLRDCWTWLAARASPRLPRLDWAILALLLLANGAWLVGAARETLAGGWVGEPGYRTEMLAMRQMADYLRGLEPADGALATNHLSTASWWFLYTGRRGVDALVRADDAEPFFTRRAAQGDPVGVAYFVYQRPNGSPTGGAEDLPVLQAALAARGASTEPLYCVRADSLCVYAWSASRPPTATR